MEDIKNLHADEAVKKIKEIAAHTKTCMLNSRMEMVPPNSRPMTIQHIEADGSMWFFSWADSTTNADILIDKRVQLLFSNTSDSEYLTLFGRAGIVNDRQKAEELWDPSLKTWFNEGLDDPNLSLLKFQPEEGYYWDVKTNKFIQSVKIAFGSVTGSQTDDTERGRVSL